jgi:hypothetical protein
MGWIATTFHYLDMAESGKNRVMNFELSVMKSVSDNDNTIVICYE